MNSNKFLSDEERLLLEEYLRARLETDRRNALVFLMALNSGARASELLALSWQDIDLESGAVRIKTLKQRKNKNGVKPVSWREVAVPRFMLAPLSKLKVDSPDRPFDLSYSRLAELWRMYRPCPKPFHCLRHSFAMRAYERTKDIRFVQKALGHRSITNTMVYADCEYTSAQFKKLMRVR